MSISPNQERVGSLNEGGIIYDLKKCGFTDFSSICEILGNSIDAGSDNFQFKCQMQDTKYIDDGLGMDKEKAKNMFDLCRENHSGEKSIGISGKGAKGSTLKLSRDKNVIVYTSDGKSYLKITVPWDIIFQELKYTGMITIENMNKKEEEEFLEDRINFESKTGTTIVIPNNEEVYNEILDNFNNTRLDRKSNNRIDCIFGNFSTKISLIDMNNIQNNVENLKMYNYFGFPDTHYYKSKFEDRILIYQDKRNNIIHYIWEKEDDKHYNMPKVARGISKTPRQCRIDKSNWKYIGVFNVKNGFLKNKTIFDDTNPDSPDPKRKKKIINIKGGKAKVNSNTIGDYDDEFFNISKNLGYIEDDLSNCSIFRNNHRINDKTIDGFKSTSARGTHDSYLKIALLRTSISYDTMSNQDNLLDKIIGVQSNKNQLNSDGFPKELMYMLTYIKQQVWEEIKTYFKNVYEAYNKKSVHIDLESDEEYESESESDMESQEEDKPSDLDSNKEQHQPNNVEIQPNNDENQKNKIKNQPIKVEIKQNNVEIQPNNDENQQNKIKNQPIKVEIKPNNVENHKNNDEIQPNNVEIQPNNDENQQNKIKNQPNNDEKKSKKEFLMSNKAKCEMFNQWINSTKELFNQNYKNISTEQLEQIGNILTNKINKIIINK